MDYLPGREGRQRGRVVGSRCGPTAYLAAVLFLLAVACPPPAHAAIAVSKSIDTTVAAYPSTILPGDVTAFRVTLTNDNPGSAVTGVAFTDDMTLPQIVVAGAGVVANTCGGVVTAVPGASTVSLAGGTIPIAPGGGTLGTCDLVFEVTSLAAGTAPKNTIDIGAVTGNDPAPQQNGSKAEQSFTVLTLSPPTVSKSFSPATILQNDETSTLTIVIANPNTTADLPLTTVVDHLPAGVEVAAVPNALLNCTGTGAVNGVFAPAAGATTLQLNGGTIGRSGACTLSVAVIATSAGPTGSTTLTNTLAPADVGNSRGLTPSAPATATLTVNSPLRVTKAFSPSNVVAGQQATLSITLHNDSPSTDVSLTTFTDDPIGVPAGLSVTGAVSNTCGGVSAATPGNTGVTLTGGSLARASSCTITVPYTPTIGGAHNQTFTDTIPVNAVGNTGGFIAPASAPASVVVGDEFTVAKALSPATVAPGNRVSYTLTVRNYTGAAQSAVTLTDPLPAGMIALASPAPTVSAGCAAFSANLAAPAAPAFTFDMPAGALPAPGICTVTFAAQIPVGAAVGATFGNLVPAQSVKTPGVCGTPGVICNTAASNTVTATVIAAAPFTKAFAPALLSEGASSRLTITFSNNSANPLTSLDLTDSLPALAGPPAAQVVIANPANAATSCGAGASVTATPGASSLRIQNGTIPARASGGTGAAGSCVLAVDVVGPAGAFTNTVPGGSLSATETLPDATTHTVTHATDVTAPLTYTPSLTAAKSFAPATVQAGGKARLSIRLGNVGTGTLNDAGFSDVLPADMKIAAPAVPVTTCAGGVLSAVPGAATFAMSGAVIPPGGTCDALVDVVASAAGDSVNTLPAGSVTAAGGIRNTAPVTATLHKSAGGLVVTKSISPNTISAPGQTSTVTLTLRNTGGIALDGVALTDYFTTTGLSGGPLNGMRIASVPHAGTSCRGGAVTAVTNGTSFALNGGQLAPSGGAGDECTVSVDVTTLTVGTIQNTIAANAASDTQGVTNTLPAVSSLATLARLGVQKQFTPPTVVPGQRARLQIKFLNPLAVPLTAIAVTDHLPAGLVVAPGPNPSTTCVGGTLATPTADTVQFSGGTLAAASSGATTSCVAEIDVVAAGPGTYINTLPAGSVTALAGGNPVANQPPDVTAPLEVRSPVTLAKSFTPAIVLPGQASKLTVVITNPNTVPLTAAHLVDALPTGLAVALVPNAATTCGGAGVTVTAPPSATQVALAGATIPASGSCQFTVDTLSNVGGLYTNTIPAGALTTAEGVTNDEPASSPVRVTVPPTLAKQFTPVAIPAGGTSTLTLTLGNANASAATLTADLVDTLPAAPGPLVIAAPNGLSGTCTLASVTATAGSGVIRYASGAQIPAGGCTISVNVTGAVNGTYTNAVASNALETDFGSNPSAGSATLDISPLGYVSGRVFADNSSTPNGVFDSGTDKPLSGVTLTLTGTDFGADGAPGGGDDVPVTRTTLTDVLGNYAFTGLSAGQYTVTEPAQPPGTRNGITSAGTISGAGGGTPGTASALAVTPSAISNITLRRSGGGIVDGSPNNDFAEVVLSSISGTVFLDQNNNGVKNGADAALANVTIELLDAGNAVIATTTTDASGQYRFDNLAPGTYSIREPAQPAGSSNGKTVPGAVPNGGTSGAASAPNVTPSRISNLVLPPNTLAANNDFAELPNGRTISGRVFLDFDDSGALNGSDHGIAGQTLNLSGVDSAGNPVTATTTTSADGSYAFTALPEGTYVVTQPAQPAGTLSGKTIAGSTGGTATLPAVTPSAISAIDLTGANTVSAGNDFAERLGNAVDLTIVKTNTPPQFAAGSSAGFYSLTVRNLGSTASSGLITVTDTLPAGMTAVAAPAGAPWSCSLNGGASVVTCTTSQSIAGNGAAAPITLRVAVAGGLAGQSLINIAQVGGGGETAGFEGNNTASDPTQLQIGASVSGHAWLNTVVQDQSRQAGEPGLAGWTVEARRGGVVIATVVTDANGDYTFSSLPPTTGPGDTYELVFRSPAGLVFGKPVSSEPGVDLTGDTIARLTVAPGANIVEQNLPLDPSGIVYDSVTRQPVAGATVTLLPPAGFNPALHLLGGASNLTQVTDASGAYQFLILPGAPAGTYALQITSPSGYVPGVSTSLPPQTGALTIGPLPNPRLVSPSSSPPPVGAPAVYYLEFVLSAGSADVINNHIALDPVLGGALTVTKTSPLVNVAKGDLVPYTVTARNNLSSPLSHIALEDQVPPGFKYRLASASIDGLRVEPTARGRQLTWPQLSFRAGETKTLKLILIVGSGVGEGEYVNKAYALSELTGASVSNVATATVRVVPDPTFDCSDVIGKVFDDRNANGYQDEGEPGLPNVRVATVNGLLVTTDHDGRFHVPCADVPQADHGANFVMKLDVRTLPSGYRLTTENPRDVRLTRGKLVKLNFGAALHRVVRIEIGGTAFEDGRTALLPRWSERLDKLLVQIKDRPSVIRLAFDLGTDELASSRKKALVDELRRRWEAQRCCYPLSIEIEGEGDVP